jgi:acyl transferase domain-containing protein
MAQGFYTRQEYHEKLTDVAKLYVKGYLFNWTAIYNTNYYKKISLPAYPFSNVSYWIQNYNKYQENTSFKPDRLHPLVGANTATLQEQKYTTLFSINEFYIQGHQIENEKVMPGVVYLEMARAAGEMAAEENVKSIKDVIWGSPITIEETKEVCISLYPKEEEQVEFTVYTEDADERTVHANGILLYEYDKIEEHIFSLDTLEVRKRCNTHFTGEDCYEMFETLGFHYDKNFQSIHSMYCNEKEVLAYLKLPKGLSENFETFQIHPSIMDGALQAAIGLVRNYNYNSSSIYLPFLIGKIDLVKPLTKECIVYVTLASETMTQRTNGFMFHVTVTNMEGEVLTYVNKYVVREFSQKHVEQKTDDTFEIMEDTFEIPEAESLLAWED